MTPDRRIGRRTMRLSGALCLAGSLGPVLGDMRIQYAGIAGYAGVFPIACLLLARVFALSESSSVTEAVRNSNIA